MQNAAIFTPLIVLAAWTFIIMVWMYATRIPAMTEAKIDPQDAAIPGSLNVLPDNVRQISDNYNHLFEQPTLFYAMVVAIWAVGHVDPFSVGLAWAFVILRIVHSLIQCIANRVMMRFSVFMVSWLILGIMIAKEVIALF
ncbi:MAG: MAPEG family protein [Parvularculales bacterium]